MDRPRLRGSTPAPARRRALLRQRCVRRPPASSECLTQTTMPRIPTMTTTVDTALDAQIKSAHRRMWASGDYPAVASEVIPELGAVLVQALGVQPNDKVLDAAAGFGNAAILVALVGARVTATDLAPELFDAGRRDAAVAGVDVSWLEADAERLPFDDGSFDVAMSVVGVMFTPSHQRSADALIRAVGPGGRIGLINWTPSGFIGDMFATMKPYAAPPPAGAQPPPLWGDPDHLAGLFGDKVTGVRTERRMLTVDRFRAPEDFLAFFRRPTGRLSRSTPGSRTTPQPPPSSTRPSQISLATTLAASRSCSGSTSWPRRRPSEGSLGGPAANSPRPDPPLHQCRARRPCPPPRGFSDPFDQLRRAPGP